MVEVGLRMIGIIGLLLEMDTVWSCCGRVRKGEGGTRRFFLLLLMRSCFDRLDGGLRKV